ncbi:MAG: 4-alpha-glucanotransferase, partial [Chloroflexi bacterium]|nr:4-alpha-glucanotransferase [Chloroflexota bacterium]
SGDFQRELAALNETPLVDYRGQMALKRRALAALSRYVGQSRRTEEFRRFLDVHPTVEDYARFRAAGEKQGKPWPQWPEHLRRGEFQPGDYDEDAFRYHSYAQWVAHEQMEALSRKASETGPGLYLDMPLGVNPDGYDVWRNQSLFVRGARVGAPPDGFFTLGQDWGFPPIHPERTREQKYQYLIEVFRRQLHVAGILRIDHVMGLHRLYWIPEGHDARAGTYVRYPADEIYAILTLESHRQQCRIVGENLGTVPSYVNTAMSRHGFGRMYVAQFETRPDPRKALDPVPASAVASFNTHDMPPFAAFWSGKYIESKREMGLIDENEAKRQLSEHRKITESLVEFLREEGCLQGPASPEEVHAACMGYLSRSRASLVLVSLEDLWLEDRPQNVPGTGPERPNWRRRAVYAFEQFSVMPQVVDVLREVDRVRRELA